jgi:hypothetical protein
MALVEQVMTREPYASAKRDLLARIEQHEQQQAAIKVPSAA